MSGSKRLLEDAEAQYDWARSFLIKEGTLRHCEWHPGCYYDGDGDIERIYRLASAKHKKGELYEVSGLSQLEVTDLLKSTYEDNSGPDNCTQCDKHFDE